MEKACNLTCWMCGCLLTHSIFARSGNGAGSCMVCPVAYIACLPHTLCAFICWWCSCCCYKEWWGRGGATSQSQPIPCPLSNMVLQLHCTLHKQSQTVGERLGTMGLFISHLRSKRKEKEGKESGCGFGNLARKKESCFLQICPNSPIPFKTGLPPQGDGELGWGEAKGGGQKLCS